MRLASNPSASAPSYETSVFINCPFDRDYRPIFEAILWTVQDLGFSARCATERDDSGEIRIQKIMQIIAGSKYGIHDISRAEINSRELPRFNRPLAKVASSSFREANA